MDEYKEEDSNEHTTFVKSKLLSDNFASLLTPEQAANEISSRIEILTNFLDSPDAIEFSQSLKELIIICSCFDIKLSLKAESADFYENLFQTLINFPACSTYNDIVILILQIIIHSPQSIPQMMNLNVLEFIFSILHNSFPKTIFEKCYISLSCISRVSKSYRDQVIIKFPINHLYMVAEGPQDDFIVESIIKLIHSYSLYPLDQQEISDAILIIRLLFVNNGQRHFTKDGFCTAINSLQSLVKSPVFKFEMVDFLDQTLHYFGKDDDITESLCYINCRYIVTSRKSFINMDLIADLIDLESKPSIIAAAARSIGLICFNMKDYVQNKDNFEYLQYLFEIFNQVKFSAKEELGFAIVGFFTYIKDQILYEYIILHADTFFDLINLSNIQTLTFIVNTLERLRLYAAFNDLKNDFYDFLVNCEIISRLEDLYDELSADTQKEKILSEKINIFLDNIQI